MKMTKMNRKIFAIFVFGHIHFMYIHWTDEDDRFTKKSKKKAFWMQTKYGSLGNFLF